jgi:HPt (histidine-containing phosphotransfer) domain-containing protein
MTSFDPSDELESVHMIFGDDFAELVALYTTDSPKRLATLREAITEDDRARVAKVAHAFGGSCISIGATSLAALCQDLESCARTLDACGLARKLDLIAVEYERIRARLQAMLGRGPCI